MEWLESLEDYNHMKRFRPLGGSCAADTTGHTLIARTLPDHDEMRTTKGKITCLCDGPGELIVIE